MTIPVRWTAPHPVDALRERGLVLPDAAQVFVDRSVDLDRLQAGAVLCPGARVSGGATWLGPGAVIGSEGPATVVDSAVDADVEVCSGYVEGAVLFRGAKLGGSAHVRPATILEEGASTAHAVRLKQTVLLSFVTLGSLINACDLLVGGGTSKDDHSEVGSGFIHFNFTPWGARGDKATPSLVGNVHEGVFLDRRRIFVGGLSGMVGPLEVGFGAVTAAGQVVRRNVAGDRLVGAAAPAINRPVPEAGPPAGAKLRANCRYIGQLCALRAWYVDVRIPRAAASGTDVAPEVLRAAVDAVDRMIVERLARLAQYAPGAARTGDGFRPDADAPPDAVGAMREHRPDAIHLDWVRSLTPGHVATGVAWLGGVADRTAAAIAARFPGLD